MSKVLLREFFELKCDDRGCRDLLTESEKKQVSGGALIFPAILQEAEVENGNGRIYPKLVLEKEIGNYQKLVKEGRAIGECDHPDESVINLRNASHMVNRVWWDGNSVLGTIKVLNTPSGNILKELINSGVQVGISSRGLGSVKEENGKSLVEDDFQLICFDCVSDPSTPGAFMNLTENKVPIEKIFTKADRINRALNNVLGSYHEKK